MSRPEGSVPGRTAGQEHGPELLQPGDVLSVAQEFGLMAGMDR